MFSGIIEAQTRILKFENLAQDPGSMRLVTGQSFDSPPTLGESIAHDGVCLTVVHADSTEIHYDLGEETLRLTHFKTKKVGDFLNVERSLRIGDRNSGHMVQGHVDGTAMLKSVKAIGQGELACYDLEFELDQKWLKYCVLKGSIALNGVSLTLHELSASSIRVQIIPHTWKVTNLSHLKPRDQVNLEVDSMAKYVEKWVQHFTSTFRST